MFSNVLFRICLWIPCLNFTWNQKSSWNISKTCSLKRKNYHHLIWQQTFMKITISVARCLKRKTILVWIREYINKNLATCKSLCNLQELYTAFKEKHQNINIGSQSSVPWDPNGLSWLPEKLLTLYAFVALKKNLCC